MTGYSDFFRTATTCAPLRYQERFQGLAAVAVTLGIATGLGKTEATILPFIFGVSTGTARFRRLIYVLPMRSLVEQTRDRVTAWLDRLKAAGIGPLPRVALLLGGDVDDTWVAHPDEPWILIGTQDMILSRALNRGYASSPFAWPMAFGALNNDAHWILDEVQLQGVGVRTAAQLQGLREKLGTFGASAVTFCSATIERAWIDTVDHAVAGRGAFELSDDERVEVFVAERLSARKTVRRLGADASDLKAVAAAVDELHRDGTLTIVVVNQVGRAQQLARALRKLRDASTVALLHARFRPPDRARTAASAFTATPSDGAGRIIVATQVIEAGVDIDAATLVSELAPWASIVQRLGRCNRRGELEDATFAWIDLDDSKARAPYDQDELVKARELLESLEGHSAAPESLPSVPLTLDANATLRRVDLFDLFDTAPDISGNDVDVSRFIREGGDFTASVFWRDEPPAGRKLPGITSDRPRRDELCPAALDQLKRLIERLRAERRREDVRVRAPLAVDDEDAWRVATAADVRPGAVFWIRSSAGGYDECEGFDPEAKTHVKPIEPAPLENDATQQYDGGGACGSDLGTSAPGVELSLRRHAEETRGEAVLLVQRLGATLEERYRDLVVTAAAWHDAGKVHDVFQDTMHRAGCPSEGGPWAKSPGKARHTRRRFRHEVVSALAWLQQHDRGPDDDLVAYLVGAHHGKLRVAAYPYPGDPIGGTRTILGVQQDDPVAATVLAGDRSPAFVVDLSLFDIGSTNERPTWSDRVLALRDDPKLGPFRLGYLETLVRVADWRASAAAALREPEALT
jgi:CRISPR-associated endonuclease/helicase Cas3